MVVLGLALGFSMPVAFESEFVFVTLPVFVIVRVEFASVETTAPVELPVTAELIVLSAAITDVTEKNC
jgi:hypothetical protein